MDRPVYMTSVIAITIWDVIQKLITKIDFQCQINFFGSPAYLHYPFWCEFWIKFHSVLFRHASRQFEISFRTNLKMFPIFLDANQLQSVTSFWPNLIGLNSKLELLGLAATDWKLHSMDCFSTDLLKVRWETFSWIVTELNSIRNWQHQCHVF